MSKEETFSNSMNLAVIHEYEKDNIMQISTVVRHVYHAACRKVLWKDTF